MEDMTDEEFAQLLNRTTPVPYAPPYGPEEDDSELLSRYADIFGPTMSLQPVSLEPESLPQLLPNERYLHIICVDCGHDVIVPSLDDEGSRYNNCVKCTRKVFVIHEAGKCLMARKFCPIWRERKGWPRLTVKEHIAECERNWHPGPAPLLR